MEEGEAPEEELTRLLVATAAVRSLAAERIAELAASVDHPRLAEHLERQRLVALVCSRLSSSEVTELPTWLRSAADSITTQNRRRALMLEATLLDAVTRLERESIESVPLKGPWLARDLYGDVGVRPATDVDLLVRGTQLDRARDVLVRAGYLPPADPLRGGRPLLHYRLYPGGGTGPPIDLHWRVHWYESAFADELMDRSRRDGRGDRRPDPTLGLAALLLFWVRDGLIGLRYPADIAAWWDRFGADIERVGLQRLGESHPALRRALRVPTLAAASLVGLPADYLWGEQAGLDRREATALRLANWTIRGDPDQVAANRALIDWLVAPPGGGRAFLRRQLFAPAPPEPVGVASGPAWRRPVHRLTHPVKLIVRHAFALWSVRCRRTWAPRRLGAGRGVKPRE